MIDQRERFERAFEHFTMPEPSWDRLLDRRDRKRRNQRITAVVVGMVVFIAGIWLATGGLFHRTQRPGAPGPTVQTPSPTLTRPPVRPNSVGGRGLIGLPPEGATPSTPERGELVLTSWAGTTSGPRTWMWVYADGRVIRRQEGVSPVRYGASDHFTPFVEQRLTPEGVDLLRSEVMSTGLFDENLDLDLDTCPCYPAFIEVRSGDRFVRVSYSPGGRQPATQEQARSLLQLDARLGDPASWLPASAFEDIEIRPYVPSRFAICYSAGPAGHPAGAARILAALPDAAADLLRPKDRTTESGDHCSNVSTEEARALADAFDEAGYGRDQVNATFVLNYTFEAPYPLNEISIAFEPILPHGVWTCSPCG